MPVLPENYELVVEIRVQDREGRTVDHRGLAASASNRSPLKTIQRVTEYSHVENAHEDLNRLHALIKALSALLTKN